MFPTFAIFNFLTPSSILFLGVVGLLLFGKDLPLIARNLAKEYFRYKKMINEATADIQREMESAANILESEKRDLQSGINSNVPSLDNMMNPEPKDPYNNTASENCAYGEGDVSVAAQQYSNPSAPAKPAADPLSLDVPSPSTLSHRVTEAVKSPAANVAALDTYMKGVPPPSKIPPSL